MLSINRFWAEILLFFLMWNILGYYFLKNPSGSKSEKRGRCGFWVPDTQVGLKLCSHTFLPSPQQRLVRLAPVSGRLKGWACILLTQQSLERTSPCQQIQQEIQDSVYSKLRAESRRGNRQERKSWEMRTALGQREGVADHPTCPCQTESEGGRLSPRGNLSNLYWNVGDSTEWTKHRCSQLLLIFLFSPIFFMCLYIRKLKVALIWAVNAVLVLMNHFNCALNDFNEPRLLHIPIHRKVLNSLTWDVWFSFFSSNVLTFLLPGLCCKNAHISWFPLYLFGAVPQSCHATWSSSDGLSEAAGGVRLAKCNGLH